MPYLEDLTRKHTADRGKNVTTDYHAAFNEACSDFEDSAMLIKRLVRKCYTLGHRSKLTDDAMDFINDKYAACCPLRKMIHDIAKVKPNA